MKHLKSYNEAFSNSKRVFTDEEKLKSRLVRRLKPKSDKKMVDKLIEELKKKPKKDGFIEGLMWSMGLDGYACVDGDTIVCSHFKKR